MARTNRNTAANNVDALDNLDLDDMFTAGGDALFEGLDLDMGNMEDITENKASAPANPASAPSPEPSDTAPRRRKTKRKTTAPTFFDDLDDDEPEHEPVKKKKRTSKGAAPKRGGRGKKTAAAETTGSTASSKKAKSSKAVAAAATPANAGASEGFSTPSGVAAAGQFGGRQKKTIGSKSTTKGKNTKLRTDIKARGVLPMAANRGATLPQGVPMPPPAPAAAPPPAPATATVPKAKPMRPQSLFCGLGPSNSLFYPFLPALPSEVALKNRKVYALLERVHTSFTGYFGHGSGSSPPAIPEGSIPAREEEAIFKLTQEAYKEDKNAATHPTVAERSQAIGSAIGAVRKTISLFDKTKLAQDLLAVCALLRRQHDFVKQNNANMERWCREHFNDEDFAAVYHDGKKKRKAGAQPGAHEETPPPEPILSTFKVSQIRVKIKCTGFKEPKTALVATLPFDAKRAAALKTAKKKTETEGSPVVGGVPPVSQATAAAIAAAAAADLNYSTQTPAKRRKVVGGLIARVAQTLESRENQKIEKRRQIINVQERKRKDVAEDTSVAVIHTAGMWKHIQESGYFEDPVADADLEERIEMVRTIDMSTDRTEIVGSRTETTHIEKNETEKVCLTDRLTDRLIGLLVEEGEESENGAGDNCTVSSDESHFDDTESLLDLSELTVDERAEIQLHMLGLVPNGGAVVDDGAKDPDLNGVKLTNEIEKDNFVHGTVSNDLPQEVPMNLATASSASAKQQGESIDAMVDAMKEDLQQRTGLINARATFAQKIARSNLETPEGATRRRQREASILARGAALLKRNKEAKSKAGKKAKQDDDLKLPW